MRPTLLLALLQAAATAKAALFNRGACQSPTPNPLTGCPEATTLVGPSQNHTTIQSAVLSLPRDNSTRYILILPGNYTEQINVTRTGPLYLLGQTAFPNNQSHNSVTVIWRNATGANIVPNIDNVYTSTLIVAPTANSSATGSGPSGAPVAPGTPFGNVDFRTYNVDFVNDFAPYAVGPSLAVAVSYANAGFYYSGFYSYQDTVYVGKLANVYFYQSMIAGQTDFFYGYGTAWVESCQISLRNCGGGITAWKGSNTTYENKFGIYIHASTVLASNSSIATTIRSKCSLGRPWNSQHRSVFAATYLDASIRPAGYSIWGATDPRVTNQTFMAEYKDAGPGWNATARVQGGVTKVLSDAQWAPYSSPAKVFDGFPGTGTFGYTGWIDPQPGVKGVGRVKPHRR